MNNPDDYDDYYDGCNLSVFRCRQNADKKALHDLDSCRAVYGRYCVFYLF